ncbi:Uncharacterised protein [Vibrio cholerae]|nr:Uncharacterised protein [Vibrio cholerae]
MALCQHIKVGTERISNGKGWICKPNFSAHISAKRFGVKQSRSVTDAVAIKLSIDSL